MQKIIITLLFGLILISASAQVERLVGPRIGMTFITPGSTADVLNEGFDYATDNETKLGETGVQHLLLSMVGSGKPDLLMVEVILSVL